MYPHLSTPNLQLVGSLNAGNVAGSTEVVVSPPAVYLDSVRSRLRKDFAVAAQVRSVSGSARDLSPPFCGPITTYSNMGPHGGACVRHSFLIDANLGATTRYSFGRTPTLQRSECVMDPPQRWASYNYTFYVFLALAGRVRHHRCSHWGSFSVDAQGCRYQVRACRPLRRLPSRTA
jgi:hypothetical protein